MSDLFNTLTSLQNHHNTYYYSLPALEKTTGYKIHRLPLSLRIVLESVLRNIDNQKITKEDVLSLASWAPAQEHNQEIPFLVSRIVLQDFTGVPLLADLAAMRDAVKKQGQDSKLIEPIVPVDLVIDHSVQVDRSGTADAFSFNLELELQRNKERYEFLSWGQQAFKTFRVVPPGVGIVHQVNLEYLASLVLTKQIGPHQVAFFDTLLGTDSHTTMIGGLGALGWGVGGIEAEAAMLGQPYFFQTPEVVGVYLTNQLQEGVTATDLTLYITQVLRKEKVVGKFVEFFGEGVSSLSLADRATIGNMAPEYGATVGFFPVDEKTLTYLTLTGRSENQIALIRDYFNAQGLFGVPKKGDIDFSSVIEVDLATITPSVAGPRRPQDRISLNELKTSFQSLLKKSVQEGGYGKSSFDSIPLSSKGHFHMQQPHITGGIPFLGSFCDLPSFSESEMVTNRPVTQEVINPGYVKALSNTALHHGSIVIAAITSCTNTSNPSVMIGAGLLAKKAVQKGLKIDPAIKTSLAPGSRVVTDYLEKAGLQSFLDQLGFQLVAYGCTTCIGNSGPLDEAIEEAIQKNDLIVASVLSGNRNFEARIHGLVKANFLMSPPLVIAFALAGRIDIDLTTEPLGYTPHNQPVFLKDIWPTTEEIEKTITQALSPDTFQKRYKNVFEGNALWQQIKSPSGANYTWQPSSSYIQQPPFLDAFQMPPPPKTDLLRLRALALLGDSVTTDHISPAGAFSSHTPAGQYLLSLGVQEKDFNSYGSRRGNHHVMMRGTFANTRLRNAMVQSEGGYTKLMPEEKEMTIFEASQAYAEKGVSLILFAGKDYGMGSSRDWAAKGTALLGVRVVVAQSFERIHRSNLIGMGILPLQFLEGDNIETLGLTGKEEFSLLGLESMAPKQQITLKIEASNQPTREVTLLSRLDTDADAEYYLHRGILPYVLRQML